MALIALFIKLVVGLIVFGVVLSLAFAIAMPLFVFVLVMAVLGILLFPLRILFG